jgi:hypothetical protein
MTPDADSAWITPSWEEEIPRCRWIKVTQLLGEVRCYLQLGHDGAHCSVDWMEWT